MIPINLYKDIIIEEILWTTLPYTRPRTAGRNARLDVHGIQGNTNIARICAGGHYGYGWSNLSYEAAKKLIGQNLGNMFNFDSIKPEYKDIELPILDLIGQMHQTPVYAFYKNLMADYSVPVYDTSIYIDEPSDATDDEAVSVICDEITQGMSKGHTNFKIKVGRSNIWMDVMPGIERDIKILQAVRETAGKNAILMADANNGYNYNLAKLFLKETKNVELYWMEEAFAEDQMLYRRLREWMKEEQFNTLIADGEGDASRRIEEWAFEGLIDILQYDARDHGFFNWIETSKRIATHGVKAAPHNYGCYYGNFMQAHLAAALGNYTLAEWDESRVDGIDTSGYSISHGNLHVPNLPGFGLVFDNEKFTLAAKTNGWLAK